MISCKTKSLVIHLSLMQAVVEVTTDVFTETAIRKP